MARRQIILGAGPIVPPLPVPPLPPPEQPSPAAVRKQIEDAIQEREQESSSERPVEGGDLVYEKPDPEDGWLVINTDSENGAIGTLMHGDSQTTLLDTALL
jgi:hypothetical protein